MSRVDGGSERGVDGCLVVAAHAARWRRRSADMTMQLNHRGWVAVIIGDDARPRAHHHGGGSGCGRRGQRDRAKRRLCAGRSARRGACDLPYRDEQWWYAAEVATRPR